MIKNKKQKIPISSKKIYPLLLILSTLSMCVGYAVVNSITLDINGTVISKKQDGIFITDVRYISNVNADIENSQIINAYQTNLNSNITLSNIDPNSSITYEIDFYNSTDINYYFDDTQYLAGNSTYSNENIVFEITNLNNGDVIKSKSNITVTITFHYKDYVLSNNNLISLINFKFEKKYTNQKVSFLDLMNDSDTNQNITINGTGVDINDDYINFNRDDNLVNNLMISGLSGDYQNGFTFILDFSTENITPPSSSDTSGGDGSANWEMLFMARTTNYDGFSGWYHTNILTYDLGGASPNRNDKSLQGKGRYLFIISIGGNINKSIIINKSTNEVVGIYSLAYDLSLLNEGFKNQNYTIQFGGDSVQTFQGRYYQSTSQIKYYSFYLSDEALNTDELPSLLKKFDYNETINLS